MPRAPSPAPEKLKMSALARRSGVPAATIKHYLREGLLPEEHVTTRARNSASYDVALVERVKAIKELQRTRFLPLRVIKGVLDGAVPADADDATAAAIASALEEMQGAESRTRAQLVAAGMPEEQLDFFRDLGVVTPEGAHGEERYSGDDLALLQTLGAARKAGLSPEMLPKEIVQPYVRAIRELVRIELRMFREGVVARAADDLVPLTQAATKLSERLVVRLRRKMLLPTLQQLVAEESARREAERRAKRKKARARRRKELPT